MGDALGWDAARRHAEIAEVEALLSRHRHAQSPPQRETVRAVSAG
jgi:hypothetical protein